MPKDRPVEAKTRRGNRVYRNRFTHDGTVRNAADYSFAVKKEGERHRLNLGRDLDEAKKMADRIHAFMLIPSNTFADLFEHPDFKNLKKPRRYRRKARQPEIVPIEKIVPNVEDILDRYQKNAVHVSRTTMRNNCYSLRHLAAHVLGLRPIPRDATDKQRERWRSKVGKVSITEFTLPVLEEIRTAVVSRAGSDPVVRGRTITTLNSKFRCVRSVFSERMMALYSDFEIPDPLPFRQIKPFREPSRRYISKIDVGKVIRAAKKRFWDGELSQEEREEREAHLSRIEKRPHWKAKTREDLVRDDKARFIILMLTISCGLRPKETARLTWEQVDFMRRQIHVAVTSYDTPKARSSESTIDVSATVLEYLKEFRPHSNVPPFVIPAIRQDKKETDHPAQLLFKGLFRWLRTNGVDCENPLSVFRKEAGSIIYEETFSYDLAADFLRNDPRIAREHYVGRKRRLEVEVPGLQADLKKSA